MNTEQAVTAVPARRTLLIKPSDLWIAGALFLLAAIFLIPTAWLPVSGLSFAIAVTVVSHTHKYNVAGARWLFQWNITGDNAQTLDTGIAAGKRVLAMVEPCTITAIAQSTVNAHIRLTFTTTGPFTAVGLIATVG